MRGCSICDSSLVSFELFSCEAITIDTAFNPSALDPGLKDIKRILYSKYAIVSRQLNILSIFQKVRCENALVCNREVLSGLNNAFGCKINQS